jgi:hypothetical protein
MTLRSIFLSELREPLSNIICTYTFSEYFYPGCEFSGMVQFIYSVGDCELCTPLASCTELHRHTHAFKHLSILKYTFLINYNQLMVSENIQCTVRTKLKNLLSYMLLCAFAYEVSDLLFARKTHLEQLVITNI